MNLKRVLAIYLRQFFLIYRNKSRLISIFYWSILDILLWGFITRYLDSVGQSEVNFLTVILGAVILWNLLIRVQQGMTMAFLEDVWSRNFVNLFASPLRISEYVLGIVLVGITTSIMALIGLAIVAWLAFAYNIFSLGLYLVPFIFIIFLFGLALGMINTAVVFRFGPAAEWLAWAIPFLFTPFAGIFYPISALPLALQPIAKLVPPSYAFEGMRSVLTTGTLSMESLFTGILIAALYLVLAYWFLLWIYRIVVKNGLLARFTAEIG